MRFKLLSTATGVFLAVLALSWMVHGTGVVKNDLSRNIFIPEELTMPLQVKAAFDGQKIFFRYRWPAREPHIYHDMLKYEGGKWVRIGRSVAGPQPEHIYEDRVTMLVDDGAVPEFELPLFTDRDRLYETRGAMLEGSGCKPSTSSALS